MGGRMSRQERRSREGCMIVPEERISDWSCLSDALTLAAREAWEVRVLEFLVAGHACCPDGTPQAGTPISTWMTAHEALRHAAETGRQLTDAERALVKNMGTADRAIASATRSAKQAEAQSFKEAEQRKAERAARQAAQSSPTKQDGPGKFCESS